MYRTGELIPNEGLVWTRRWRIEDGRLYNETIIEDQYADDRPWDMEWLDDDTILLTNTKDPEDKWILYRQKSE